ncbi:MAG: hypothetical protein FVQ82_02275 [Planctomycetes bacterium]|nr:hypothetical protein [Planctomycetota bacterium]
MSVILCGQFLFPSSLCAADIEHDFKEPPLKYKTIPLWSLNGKLTTKEIVSQIKASRDKSGFSGVAVLPVSHTEPKYLTEDYFARYNDILKTSKELGMSVIFYDDIDFPSGSAGGQMKEQFPNDVAHRLDKKEVDVEGPKDWTETIPKGVFMGAVAMNLQTFQRRDISDLVKDGRIAWRVPAGKWKLMLFSCVNAGDRVDYLNPVSVARFCTLTYDQYYKRFSKYFGSTITMNFFDDINVREFDGRVWTPIFNEYFQKQHGYNPVSLYPALWYDIGPDTTAARVALLDFRAELLAEGYPRKVNEWCSAHGIGSTGHGMGQYHPQPTFLAADHIKFYRHCDIPMIDSIHYYGHGRPGFKMTSSASYSYDRPITAVEIYGNYHPFDKTMLYRSGMELFARGGNFFLPCSMWYDPERVWFRPLISHFSEEIGPVLAHYNNWAARSSLLLQGGRHVADISVLYPVATMQAYAQFDKVGGLHPGLRMPKDTDLNMLSDLLTGEIRRDFTFLHPEILDGKCYIDGDKLHLENKTNYEDYSVIIIPSVAAIHWSNLQKIKAFYDAGGKVIATTQLPTSSAEFGHDREVREVIAAMFPSTTVNDKGYARKANEAGGASYFVPSLIDNGSALAAALQDAMPVPDVRFGPGTPLFKHLPQSGSGPPKKGKHAGMLSYIHKVKSDRNIFYFANSTDEAVEVDVVLRGRLTLQSWNPGDGSITDVKCSDVKQNGMHCTLARLKLGPVQSVFFLEVPQ